MGADRRELSEVVFGLVMENRLPATLVRPEWLAVPYDKGVEILQKKGASREDVVKELSSSYITDAHDAVKRMNGIGDMENFDWVSALKKASQNADDAPTFKKLAKKLEENEDIDWLKINALVSSRIAEQSYGLVRASEITEDSYNPFQKTGWDALDKTVGGIPADGPIIIYGLTGVGKSTFAISLIDHLLHTYPDKKAAIYTLEMSAEHYKWRIKNMYPSTKEVMDRLYISGSVHDIEELVAEVTVGKYDYVVMDDMDNIVKSNDAAEYERVYRRVKEVCRFMKIPFFVLCQPNRVAKAAVFAGERFLGPYDVAWSGSAENSAALLVALQKTNKLDMKSEEFPTSDNDMFYCILWKSRDGWPGNYDGVSQCGPGAIVMLEDKQMWRGKPYGGKWRLHNPDAGGKKMSKKKSRNND